MSEVTVAAAAGASGLPETPPDSGSVPLPEVQFGADGLVPAVVQDASDGRVLMLAWMDAEALAATVETGEVHFHSRSRDRLWRKGETSGNVLRLVDVAIDCDGDALLVTADPVGPTCHRDTRSCFDAGADRSAAPASAPADRHDAPADSPTGAPEHPTRGPTGSKRSGRRSRLARPNVLPAPIRRASSTAAWTPSAARSRKRRPSC